ncbi:MAG: hypothetical protein M3Q97_02400, partial [Bacteroidota bacterium]|nr:hypothetical protein [Bacteroidota bacterium]
TDAENRLYSKRGYYYARSRDMYFRKNVELVNPEYTMRCDTLQYNIFTRKATFHGPTTIQSANDFLYCETGEYHTLRNTARFGKNAYLHSEGQYLYGDSLFYDRAKGYGQARGNIRVIDSTEKLLIRGQFAEHFQKTNKTFITRQVLASKGYESDSLFLRCDTLRAEYDTTGKYRILRGNRNARVFSTDFQSLSDSVRYSFVDSTIELYNLPVMWFADYQATADNIKIYTRNNDIDHVELMKNAFLVKPEDSLRYSQIKGRDMIGYFSENKLYQIDVNGNGESIYYAKDEEQAYIGMNYIICSNIQLFMADQQINKIKFIEKPSARFIPMLQIEDNDSRLPGFTWRINERPVNLEDFVAVK